VTEPGVSVVVATWRDAAGLGDCLDALAPQRNGTDEVIVVSTVPTDDLRPLYPWASWLSAPATLLIPHLWSLGIAAARRDVVALTTAHFVPAPDWIAVIGSAHARLQSPAVGGPIDPPRNGRLVDWATYFLRYSAYLGYEREQTVPDLAGDNASYKRASILSHPELLRDGFWEQEFHARLRSLGQTLVFVPALRVRLQRSLGFGPFLGQRLRHGREFGLARLSGRSAAWRAAAIAVSPLIPAIVLAKVARRVLRSGRALGPFLAALPLLSAFALAWAAGEASAYVAPGRRATALARRPD
jgi:hypothetical protein